MTTAAFNGRWAVGRLARGLLVLVACGLVVAALAVAGVAALAHGMQGVLDGATVTVNGERWLGDGPSAAHVVAAMVGLLVAGAVLVTLVPLVLALAFGAVALAVGMALVPLLLVMLVALSPLWLPVLVLWLALRRPRRPATTMAG